MLMLDRETRQKVRTVLSALLWLALVMIAGSLVVGIWSVAMPLYAKVCAAGVLLGCAVLVVYVVVDY